MNYLLKNILRKLAPCVGLAALFAAPTFAQTSIPDLHAPRPDINVPLGEGRISQPIIHLRVPIPYVPLIDPAKIQLAATVTLRNGKTMNSREYWTQMNNYEKKLNAVGYTLRSKPGGSPGTPQRIELQENPTPTKLLQQQGQALSAAYIRNMSYQPLNLPQEVQRQRALAVVNPNQIITAANPSLHPVTLKEVKNYNFGFGNSATDNFSASLNGSVELDGTSTSTSLSAEADAGGSLFGQKFNLVTGSGKLSAPQNGKLNVNLNASVVGFNIFNENDTVNSTFSKSDSKSKTLDIHTTEHFTLFFIPMSAKVGVQGTAGLKYAVTVAPLKATATLAPTISTNAYAQVGVDVEVASAGVGGRLTLLSLQGTLTGSVAIVPDPNSKFAYNYNASYQQTLDTLDGDLYSFVIIGDCDVSIPFTDIKACKEFDHTFYSFPGIKSSGFLFNESKTSPVFIGPQANPGSN